MSELGKLLSKLDQPLIYSLLHLFLEGVLVELLLLRQKFGGDFELEVPLSPPNDAYKMCEIEVTDR